MSKPYYSVFSFFQYLNPSQFIPPLKKVGFLASFFVTASRCRKDKEEESVEELWVYFLGWARVIYLESIFFLEMRCFLVATSTVSEKGLTTIPSKIRHLMKIKTGDKLEWQIVKKEEGVLQIRLLQDPYTFLRGKRKDPNTTYEKVEHLADSVIEREARREGSADNRS